MTRAFAVLLPILLAAVFAAPASPRYSRYERTVTPAGTGPNYFIVAPEVFQHSLYDLSDLRLLNASRSEQPYALHVDAPAVSAQEVSAALRNKGTIAGKLTFLLDTGVEEYDRITFSISARDFVTQAHIEGAALDSGPWVDLGSYPLYDFTRDRLGRNFTARLKDPARFRFLRVTIPELKPDDLTGAAIARNASRKIRYTRLDYAPSFRQEGRKTIIEWKQPKEIPLDRVTFQLPASQVNFRRPATLYCFCGKNLQIIARGDISRIRLSRKGRLIESEQLSLVPDGAHDMQYKIEIENGDDPPLDISAVYPEIRERRIYFDAAAIAPLTLYYGDFKLDAPVYDYAKLFTDEPDKALEASLGPEIENPAFQPRPDDRPWSDRHPAVLWTVMVLAVLALAAVALRGLRT